MSSFYNQSHFWQFSNKASSNFWSVAKTNIQKENCQWPWLRHASCRPPRWTRSGTRWRWRPSCPGRRHIHPSPRKGRKRGSRSCSCLLSAQTTNVSPCLKIQWFSIPKYVRESRVYKAKVKNSNHAWKFAYLLLPRKPAFTWPMQEVRAGSRGNRKHAQHFQYDWNLGLKFLIFKDPGRVKEPLSHMIEDHVLFGYFWILLFLRFCLARSNGRFVRSSTDWLTVWEGTRCARRTCACVAESKVQPAAFNQSSRLCSDFLHFFSCLVTE